MSAPPSTLTAKPVVLVTGASGKIGSAVVRQLCKAGYPVRALVRTKDARSKALESLGAVVVVGDLTDADSMAEACRGSKRALYVPPISAFALQGAVALAAGARAAGVEHIVGISQWLGSRRSPSLQSRQHAAIDELFFSLKAHGISHTCVMPGFFADLPYLIFMKFAALQGLFPFPADPDAKDAPPSVEDIARVATHCLMYPERHGGKTYRPTGPELLSVRQMVEVMGRVLKKKVILVPLPLFMVHKAMLSEGFYEFTTAQMGIYLDELSAGAFAYSAPTTDVLDVTGSPAETFEATATRHAAMPRNTRSVGNILGAWADFMVLPFRRGLNVAAYNRRQATPPPFKPALAMDNEAWKTAHKR